MDGLCPHGAKCDTTLKNPFNRLHEKLKKKIHILGEGSYQQKCIFIRLGNKNIS